MTSERLSTGVLPLVLPSLLLTSVAVWQMVFAVPGGLSPWKGGGFGMFAVLDHRSVRVDAVTEDGRPARLLFGFRGDGQFGPLTREVGERLARLHSPETLRDLGVRLIACEYTVAHFQRDVFLDIASSQTTSPVVLDHIAVINRQAETHEGDKVPLAILTPGSARPDDPASVVRLSSVEVRSQQLRFDNRRQCYYVVWGEPVVMGRPAVKSAEEATP